MPSEASAPATVLVEHRDSQPIKLSAGERDSLQVLIPGVSATAVPGGQDLYILNPGNSVGAVQLADRRFVLRPKIAIRRILFLLSYSMDPRQWERLGFDFSEEDDLFEALIPGFAFQLKEALRHGLLNGYRLEEDSLQTVRGRIRIADQLRTTFGLIPPVECSYDEFTDDIVINQLLKAAIARLGEIRIRDPRSRTRLRELAGAFANVSPISFDARQLPEVRYDRLNVHFRRPVEFARLVLRSRSVDARAGDVGGSSFLIDLAKVFEDFVVTALQETLGLPPHLFPQQAWRRHLHLDSDRKLGLRPDISWWRGDRCVFTGDVKYKKTAAAAGVQHPDLYQLLAYTTATGLAQGLLIYAAGEETESVIRIPGAGKEIKVVALDLDRDPEDVLRQIDRIADVVRAQAATGSLPATPHPLPSLA